MLDFYRKYGSLHGNDYVDHYVITRLNEINNEAIELTEKADNLVKTQKMEMYNMFANKHKSMNTYVCPECETSLFRYDKSRNELICYNCKLVVELKDHKPSPVNLKCVHCNSVHTCDIHNISCHFLNHWNDASLICQNYKSDNSFKKVSHDVYSFTVPVGKYKIIEMQEFEWQQVFFALTGKRTGMVSIDGSC